MVELHARSRLWSAVRELAASWGTTPTVRRTMASLPRNALGLDKATRDPLAHLLQELRASASGVLHPLALGTRVRFLLSQDLIHPQTAVRPEALREWLDSASAVEAAHRETLAWYRSRTAGYPLIRAPQLARNSSYTTLEYTPEFIWTPRERDRGLQFAMGPRALAPRLGAENAWLIAQATRNVLQELEVSAEWITFSEASDALDSDAKSALRSARLELTRLLDERNIDDHEPHFAWRRTEYRSSTVAAVVESLEGAARDYAQAFSALQELLQLCTTDVFGELVAYGDPKEVRASMLEFPGPDASIVEFTAPDADPISFGTGQLVWLEESLVRDVVRVEAMTMSFDDVQDMTFSFRARILDGTREAWDSTNGSPSTPKHARPGSALFRRVVAESLEAPG